MRLPPQAGKWLSAALKIAGSIGIIPESGEIIVSIVYDERESFIPARRGEMTVLVSIYGSLWMASSPHTGK